jgi:m7GpppX diphosphatase
VRPRQDDIIDNIAADSEHYARCTLTLRVGEQDPLWQRSAARAAA